MYKQEYQHRNNQGLYAGARNKFITKVYTTLSIQLLITTIAVILNIMIPKFAYIQATYQSLFWISFITSIVSLLALFLSPSLCKTFPVNMALLGVFTLSQSYLVSFICSMYTPESVLLSAVATLSATLGITFYALTTKTDFTNFLQGAYAFFSSLFLIIFVVSLVNIFFIKSELIVTLIAIVLGAVYSIYLLIDTQLIMGGRNKSLTLDNYVLGSVILYIDIVQLFLQILKILGDKKKKD